MENKLKIKCRGIILHEGKLLVVKHADSGIYALPGGHFESGENLEDTIRREIAEEFGIMPKLGRLLYINKYDTRDSVEYVEFFFEITNGADYLDLSKFNGTHQHELEDIIWLQVQDNIPVLPEKILTDFKDNKLLADSVRFIK